MASNRGPVREAWKALYDDSDSEPSTKGGGGRPAEAEGGTATKTVAAVESLRQLAEAKARAAASGRGLRPKLQMPSPALATGTSSSSTFCAGAPAPREAPRQRRSPLGLLEPESSDSGAEAGGGRPSGAGESPRPKRPRQEPKLAPGDVTRAATAPASASPAVAAAPQDAPLPSEESPAPQRPARPTRPSPSRHAGAAERCPEDGSGIRSLASFLGPDEGLAPRWSEGALPLKGGGELPEPIAACLRGYQRKGVCWLYERLFLEGRGCLLTDEMGLGKTVQVACCLAAGLYATPEARRSDAPGGAPGPALILCPPSLVRNWERELRRWGPFAVEVLTPSGAAAGGGSGGPGGDRRLRVLQRVEAGLADVVVASRGLLSRPEAGGPGAAATEALLSRRWGCIVVDEVHQAKNPRGQLHKALVALESPRKLGLTGTPLQNSLSDVWTLLRAVGAHEDWDLSAFEARFSKPIAKGQKRQASVKDLSVREDALKEFQELLNRNCLRRTKDDVALMLPGKNDRVVPCGLSSVQQAAYQNLLESADFQLALGKRELCVCGAGRPCMCGTGPVWRYVHQRQAESKGLEDEWAAADECVCRARKSPKCIALSLIVILQRLTNHLELLKPDGQPPKDSAEAAQQGLMRELCDVAFRGVEHNLCSARRVANRLQLGDPEACGKMQVLIPLLRHWRRRGQKVLVFSRSTRLLDILEACLWQQGWSPQVLRLDGTTAVGQRQRLVDEFNTSSTRAIFLISTRAGGVGLNLTSASVVVIFDPDWNPFSDLQAQDRSFRIGQTRVVEVYRLLGAGTIEEQVYVRQVWKQQLAAAAIDGTRSARRLDDKSFGLASLFELHDSSMLPALMAEAFKTKSSAQEVMEGGVRVFSDLRGSGGAGAADPAALWRPGAESDGEEAEEVGEGNHGRLDSDDPQALEELHGMFDQVDHAKVVRNDTQENLLLADLDDPIERCSE
eukprot:TRINITY_DN28545_c0_g1_i1.p1 TRINITY_DN28545_c0_g1~~TRINITY_DN28545_c0_g1_i1.p1  ORF type:complete len:972 (-),score=208.89 TRINITY_DN28545_c0_g1_i1:61-2943(-)